eukprot:CAMPEP_0170513400 /NCGR_PEP_ID=MMETSP0208-20121228/67378_1 /TAXON_ID=197538 /ORGANISM="Strombidium inclinatum, Strain S3" /LENGTH=116 /DNA_ID=CAMNT_0010797127 /DNA_START=221 /DNA_END=571 /DNA_ORIENTATION=+
MKIKHAADCGHHVDVVKPAKIQDFGEINPQMDSNSVILPRHFKFSSDEKYNSLEIVRDRLRKNKFMHKDFDPKLECEEGLKYHYNVYKMNEVTYMSPTKDPKKVDVEKTIYGNSGP